MKKSIVLGSPKSISLRDVIEVARGQKKVQLSEERKEKLAGLRVDLEKRVERALDEAIPLVEAMESLKTSPGGAEAREKKDKLNQLELQLKEKMMYGVTTGFGALKNSFCKTREDAKKLQTNLILSHCCGVGEPLNGETTRAAMFLRANSLASPHCGVRPELIQRLLDLLNADILPMIPQQGSVGSSGDLAPLAHLALGLIGQGPVFYQGQLFDSMAELKQAQGENLAHIETTFELSYKEGLSLINGTTIMTAIAVLAYWDGQSLSNWADGLGAMGLEALLGSTRAFDEIIFRAYDHAGAKQTADHIRRAIQGSQLINQTSQIHDTYSLRCIPQVHGSVKDTLHFIKGQLESHFSAVTDDPIVFSEEEVQEMEPLDGKTGRIHFEVGHFDGYPIAHIMDFLAIVMADLCSIAERRIQLLLDGNHNRGIPGCLIDNPKSINSGYMIAQYTAASLVSENKSLAHPASTDSIPTSGNTEDHVSMGTIAARKARKIIDHGYSIFAIELLVASEALSFRLGEQKITVQGKKESVEHTGNCGVGTGKIYRAFRGKKGENLAFLNGEDQVLYRYIQRAEAFLKEERDLIEEIFSSE